MHHPLPCVNFHYAPPLANSTCSVIDQLLWDLSHSPVTSRFDSTVHISPISPGTLSSHRLPAGFHKLSTYHLTRLGLVPSTGCQPVSLNCPHIISLARDLSHSPVASRFLTTVHKTSHSPGTCPSHRLPAGFHQLSTYHPSRLELSPSTCCHA